MTSEEQAALAPFDVLFSAVAIGTVPHDAITKLDPSTGYSFSDANGHTWEHLQVTRFEIARDGLDVCEICSETATEVVTFGQRYYYQNDGGKICLTRYTPRPDPNTPAQQEYRLRFKDALLIWDLLTADEKDFWNRYPEALAENLPGRSVFFRYFIKEPF